jgi:hypothetical protein
MVVHGISSIVVEEKRISSRFDPTADAISTAG